MLRLEEPARISVHTGRKFQTCSLCAFPACFHISTRPFSKDFSKNTYLDSLFLHSPKKHKFGLCPLGTISLKYTHIFFLHDSFLSASSSPVVP